jgi:hypothetical protein
MSRISLYQGKYVKDMTMICQIKEINLLSDLCNDEVLGTRNEIIDLLSESMQEVVTSLIRCD